MLVSSLEKKPIFLNANGLKIRSKPVALSYLFENYRVALEGLINSISAIHMTIKKLGELGSRRHQQIIGDILFFFKETLTNIKQVKKNQSDCFFKIKILNHHVRDLTLQKKLLKKQIWADVSPVLYQTSYLIKELRTVTQLLLQFVMELQEIQFRNDVTSMAMRLSLKATESQFNQSAVTCCKTIHILKYQINKIRKST